MDKKKISLLWQRYLSGQEEGKDAYFDAEEIDDLLESFEEEDKFTHYDEVLALGLRLHPGNPLLLIRQTKLLMYNEDYATALTLLDSMNEIDNEDVDFLRMECYVMRGDYDKVVNHLEQLIHQDCEYLESLFEYIAPILNDMEMSNEAHDFIRRGLELFPDNLILKDESCYNLEMLGDIEGAIDICNELIDQNPYSYDFWFSLGRLYTLNDEYDRAIEAIDFALTCNNASPDSELILLKAFCLFMNESYEQAIKACNEILADDNVQERVIPLLAECYVNTEDFEAAYSLLKQLLMNKPFPQEASVYLNFIRCCAELGHDDEALEYLKKASHFFPQNIRIQSLQALLQIAKGDMDDQAAAIGIHRLKEADFTTDNDFIDKLFSAQVTSRELAKEFLRNKGNKN